MCAMSSNLQTLLKQGIDAKDHGDFERARKQFQAALAEARRIKDDEGEANALLELSAVVREVDKDFAAARILLENCLHIYTQLQFDRGKAYAMTNLGSLAFDVGNDDDALQWLNRALAIFEQEQDKYGIAMTLHDIGKVQKRRRDFVSAEKQLRRSLLIFEGLGRKFAVGQVLLTLAEISFVYHQDRRQAELLLNRARALFEELGLPNEVEKVRRNEALLAKR